jgi:hypothetical protein
MPLVALPHYGYLASILTIPRNEIVAVPSLAIIYRVGRLPTLPLYDLLTTSVDSSGFFVPADPQKVSWTGYCSCLGANLEGGSTCDKGPRCGVAVAVAWLARSFPLVRAPIPSFRWF